MLHLLKASLPYRQSGYTVRSAYTLSALQADGYDPVAMTALDFPGRIADPPAPAEEVVNGVQHIRLQREDTHAAPIEDDFLDAWATAARPWVERVRPALLHVHSGHRGYETALVGQALAEAAGLPWIYEVRGFFETLWTHDQEWAEQAELTQLRRDTDTRSMVAASAVVTLSETMRDVIVASRGPG